MQKKPALDATQPHCHCTRIRTLHTINGASGPQPMQSIDNNMASKQLFLAFVISLVACAVVASQQSESQQSQAQQCQLRRISPSRPFHKIDSEGGVTELWNLNEDQFQCAGVAPVRNVLQPNSLALPMFFPAPKLVYIVKGRGMVGMTYPGCPQTFYSEQPFSKAQSQRRSGDQHQKVHRVRQGDIIAIPAGVAHWCYNDGNEDLVAVSVVHLNNKANQLDQNFRAFMLAGGQSRERRQRYPESKKTEQTELTFQNVFRAMDRQMMAEAFNIPTEVARQMQREDNRGIIVKCAREMRIMMPDEEEGERYNEAIPNKQNGLEETFCTMRIKHNIDCHRQADVYTRQAGSVRIANDQKLPILRFLGMSAEKGHLEPNAMYTPHWSMTDQRVVYAIRGELHVQIVDDNGNNVMDEMVKQGDMFVLPQFYTTISRAGSQGFEWITFKTSSRPMKSPMAGVTSVMRAMPIDVITNSYQMSPREAEQVKMNRDPQSTLLSPTKRSSY